MLSRENKKEQVSGLRSQFEKSKAHFVVGFEGLSVEQVTALRGRLREKNSHIQVARNTLVKRAIKEHPPIQKAFEDSLSGANAFVFAHGDASETAKILSEFSEETEILKLKKGMIGENILSEADIQKAAKLPSLDELRAKFLALLQTPPSALLRVLTAPQASFVRLLKAKEKSTSPSTEEKQNANN